jgi:hypothetical protein
MLALLANKKLQALQLRDEGLSSQRILAQMQHTTSRLVASHSALSGGARGHADRITLNEKQLETEQAALKVRAVSALCAHNTGLVKYCCDRKR